MDQQIDYISVIHRSQLNFKEFFGRSDLSDVIICCEETQFPAHRIVLAAFSSYFHEEFRNRTEKMLKIVFDDVDTNILQHVLKYIYEGSVRIQDSDIKNFCELLEKLFVSLPIEIDVSDRNEEESEQDKVINEKLEVFVSETEEILRNLTSENVIDKLNELVKWDIFSIGKSEIFVRLILITVSRLSLNFINSSVLAKFIFKITQEDATGNILKLLRDDTMDLFRRTINRVLPKSKDYGNFDDICTIDESVIMIENVDIQCSLYRSCRIAHFIGHLYLIGIFDLRDIYDISQLNDLCHDSMGIAFREIASKITENHKNMTPFPNLSYEESQTLCEIVISTKPSWDHSDETKNCCDIPISDETKKVLSYEDFTSIRSAEEHLFWLRNSVHKFEHNDLAPTNRVFTKK